MHEIQDVGEAALPLVSRYTRLMINLIRPYIDGIVVHSQSDMSAIADVYPTLGALPMEVVYPGPLEHEGGVRSIPARVRQADEPVRLLYFGVIRAYKGIDELATAFGALLQDSNVHLTVAGEPWSDSDAALNSIRKGGVERARIIDRYLADHEIPRLLEEADVVVVPYRRASASGPVNLTMAAGLPLVTTDVPALREACRDYGGVEFAVPGDARSLEAAIRRSFVGLGRRYENPQSWDANAARYRGFFDRLGPKPASTKDVA
jgi:glycosyltransferase involved in cell wall biosynthesis